MKVSENIAKSIGVMHTVILDIGLNNMNINGVEAFVKRYTNYTRQFKLDVLNYMNEKGRL